MPTQLELVLLFPVEDYQGGGPPEKIIAGVVGEEVGEGSRNELCSFTGILCKVIIDQLSNIIVLCGGKARNGNV